MNAKSVLRDSLRSRDASLCSHTEAIINHVTPLLWHSLSTFPSGTSHTSEHTLTVERILGILLSAEVIQQLKNEEIQLLLLACHFHDLGMAGTEYENQTIETREQARRDHAIRVGKIIREKWMQLGFQNKELAQVLAEICRGHRPTKTQGRAQWSDLDAEAILAPDCTVRLRLLSALIYAADELHIGADRAREREEDHIQIENQESCKHWKRHQSIVGPGHVNGAITFDAQPLTVVVEADLRRHVFQKALSAVRDARSQLREDGIDGSLPQISVRWKREGALQLLALRVQSDHKQRTIEQLLTSIKVAFHEASKDFEDLKCLCNEEGVDPPQVETAIERVLKDICASQNLVSQRPGGAAMLLNVAERKARELFRIANKADELDLLFGGGFAAHHAFDLLKSEYGRSYIELSMIPIANAGFGVNLAVDKEESTTLTVLKSSPTATRMLTQLAAFPSLLVKRHLLRQTVLNGALLDMLRAPGLALDPEFRSAYRELSRQVAEGQPKFISLVEELALVTGFSPENLQEALVSYTHSKKKSGPSEEVDHTISCLSGASIRLTQTIPLDVPTKEVLFGYFLLAGLRSGVPIEIGNIIEAPFEVNIEEGGKPIAEEMQISHLRFGPLTPVLAEEVDMRATFRFDAESKSAELLLWAPDDAEREGLPLIVKVPAGKPQAGGSKAVLRPRFYWPAVTVQLFDSLVAMCELSKTEDVQFSVLMARNGQRVAGRTLAAGEAESLVPANFGTEVVQFLMSISPELPVPIGIPREELAEMDDPNSTKRRSIYEKYVSAGREAKRTLATVTLRLANNERMDLIDEFLGLFPVGILGPPSIGNDDDISQSEFDRLWDDAEGTLTLRSTFASDCEQVADKIREWAADPARPFPLNVPPGPPSSPVVKSAFEWINLPHIDRVWYIERPVVFRVLPLEKIEQWEIEATYWESVGDHRRASLLKERVDESREAQTENAQPPKDAG